MEGLYLRIARWGKAALVAGAITASSLVSYMLGLSRGYEKGNENGLMDGFQIGKEVQMDIIDNAMPGTKRMYEQIIEDEAEREMMEMFPDFYQIPEFEDWLKQRSPDDSGGGLENRMQQPKKQTPSPRTTNSIMVG